LYYYRARYYDPQAGRFLSEDPIGFLSGDAIGVEAADPNLYRYVRNNPINLTDPTGQIAVAIPVVVGGEAVLDALIGLGAGAALGELISNVLERGGNQNQKDSGLEDLTNEQIADLLKDKSLSPKEKRRLQKEQKARKQRNKKKRNCP